MLKVKIIIKGERTALSWTSYFLNILLCDLRFDWTNHDMRKLKGTYLITVRSICHIWWYFFTTNFYNAILRVRSDQQTSRNFIHCYELGFMSRPLTNSTILLTRLTFLTFFASILLIQMNGAWKMVSTVGVWTHD